MLRETWMSAIEEALYSAYTSCERCEDVLSAELLRRYDLKKNLKPSGRPTERLRERLRERLIGRQR